MPQEQVESSETAFKHDYELGQRAVFPAELHPSLAPPLLSTSIMPRDRWMRLAYQMVSGIDGKWDISLEFKSDLELEPEPQYGPDAGIDRWQRDRLSLFLSVSLPLSALTHPLYMAKSQWKRVSLLMRLIICKFAARRTVERSTPGQTRPGQTTQRCQCCP